MDMPVTTGNGGVDEWSHEVIKFTVVRKAADFTAMSTGQGSTARHFILAKNVDTVEDSQVAFTGDIDINLNGFELNTQKGLQVNGTKMRIWNGTITTTDSPTTSALGAFNKFSTIEIYDNVTITDGADSEGKAAITGEGKLVFCGDNIIGHL